MKTLFTFSEFKNKYRLEYWLGSIIGEDLFGETFGYLNPNQKWNDMSPESQKSLYLHNLKIRIDENIKQ